MSKKLEVVRTTVLQLEEELETQKKEHEAELERQKAAFQEKINKLQTQMAQEVTTKTQMTIKKKIEADMVKLHVMIKESRTKISQLNMVDLAGGEHGKQEPLKNLLRKDIVLICLFLHWH